MSIISSFFFTILVMRIEQVVERARNTNLIGFKSWIKFVDYSSTVCWMIALICGAILWYVKHVKLFYKKLKQFWDWKWIWEEYYSWSCSKLSQNDWFSKVHGVRWNVRHDQVSMHYGIKWWGGSRGLLEQVIPLFGRVNYFDLGSLSNHLWYYVFI